MAPSFKYVNTESDLLNKLYFGRKWNGLQYIGVDLLYSKYIIPTYIQNQNKFT